MHAVAADSLGISWLHVFPDYSRFCLYVVTQALKTFGTDIAIAFSGAEDVALIEYAHLTGRPYRVFR